MTKLILVASVSMATLCGVYAAQAAEQPTADPNVSQANSETAPGGKTTLSEIIVTAVPTSGGLRKLDAAFSVTALSAEQIKEFHPINSADLLKASPGIYVESVGGPNGSNVEVAGFPSNGGTPYVTIQLNGSALYAVPQQTILTGTDLLRLDDTISRVELVQGGPGVLYGGAQPGLTANYILKRGTDTLTGDLGFTYGSEGAERIDGFVGGPIDAKDELYGSIGGYWSQSNGVRNPQFLADNDKQITATLSKDWGNHGSLMIYSRYEKDQDQYLTTTPYLDNGLGKFGAFPGFNPLTGTYSSKADQYEQLQVAPCTGAGCVPGSVGINMANGRGPELYVVGSNFKWDFGQGLQLIDNASYTRGIEHMVAFYGSSTNPETLQTYINNAEKADKLTGITSVDAYYTNTGASASLSQYVQPNELRFEEEHYNSFTNEAHLSYQLFPGNTLTVGNYVALYGVNLLEYSGSDMLLPAQSNPSPIGINLTNGVNTWQLSSPQGFINGPTGALASSSTGYNMAFFFSDSWKLGNWLFDAGMRTERQSLDEKIQNTAKGSLSGNPYDLYNSSATYLVAGTTPIHYNKDAGSWTVGLNYEFNPNMSAYVRVNHGVHFPAPSDLSVSVPDLPMQRAQNYQVGYKYQSQFIYADVSAFYRTFSNVYVAGASYPVPGTTISEKASFAYGAATEGVEYALTIKPFTSSPLKGFSLSVSGDYAYGTYTNSNGCYVFQGLINETLCNSIYDYNGHLLTRQPTFQTRVTPTYALPTDWGRLKAWATIEYIGLHYGDFLQEQPLPAYYDLSIGVSANIGQHWEINVVGTNLTNQVGLTQGGNADGVTPGSTITSESIDGREVSAQLKYKF